MSDELGDFSMLELFRLEVDNQTTILNDGLLALEQNAQDGKQLEALMRASHSIKGAARMVDIDAGVELAHTMEDCFVAAQNGDLILNATQVDLLLKGVDLMVAISKQEEDSEVLSVLCEQISHIDQLSAANETSAPIETQPDTLDPGTTIETTPEPNDTPMPTQTTHAAAANQEAVRVSSETLNRLVGLAGEVQVESRWLHPFADSLLQIKQRQTELVGLLDRLNDNLHACDSNEYSKTLTAEIQSKANQCRHLLGDRLVDLDEFDRRMHSLGNRLHGEVLSSRMRPFADTTRGFPRMVRDMARELGKKIDFKIEGLNTQVDRDILDRLEAPLNHLLRNAIDHGIETPDIRMASGKSETASLRLIATHTAGMLSIQVKDDGAGIEMEQLRERIVAKNLVTHVMSRELSEAELLEFLFLPGFSTREQVTEISGRGVGLDVVHSTVQQMRGVVHAESKHGQGTGFHLQLPLTLSIIRALLVEIGGEPYALPLARIDRTLKLDSSQVESLEGRQYFTLGNQHIGLVFASQVFTCAHQQESSQILPIVILGERLQRSGLIVDKFIGERNLVVHTLDSRLGKIQDISAASLLENGNPCLIIDVDDMLRSIDILIAGDRLTRIHDKQEDTGTHSKRILVVDDSITVREVERNMLASCGYQVDVAVDGMDGWNAIRSETYDLVISDIDMPRMNGFEFVQLIKQDDRLQSTPVMIVSYKDREEDRQRGLEIGADYYLTKGSFHDETLIEAVIDLIGSAE